jgi:hypothetical protein
MRDEMKLCVSRLSRNERTASFFFATAYLAGAFFTGVVFALGALFTAVAFALVVALFALAAAGFAAGFFFVAGLVVAMVSLLVFMTLIVSI